VRRRFPGVAVLVCTVLAASPGGGGSATADPFPAVAASYLVKIDGTQAWGHRPDRRLPMASLTKMMTALQVLGQGPLAEAVAVSAAAARETGTCLGLREGDRMRVADLLAATIIGSANDAARALADHFGGERFVRRMNARADALGMRDTHFANATGHDAPGHYSTARDLATLADAAMSDERFAALASTVRSTVRTVDGARQFVLENRNELVGRYPGAVGAKTGYTPGAGPCLVAWAVRGRRRVVLVLLNASNRWWDAERILDRAFSGASDARGENRR
jgi:serine-type D-Ala-D-Ala carboxypeptidase (penicillin-binding protein 5/6)